ncbi:bifunctional diguanylate cyclase/phosphodiesterase [Azoarcus sp. KH32C]|uniref:putative bifunctional diguanylate cyclase/phosphodiesterase n=1 Tax=Azoarcus sp. KH32C TaxID=748247 RepID=UPI00034B82B8|nr:EAL domain-containing protein [Azoarcus sp. KH32C]
MLREICDVLVDAGVCKGAWIDLVSDGPTPQRAADWVIAKALPLMAPDGKTLGTLTLADSDPSAFDPAEMAILVQLAEDVASGIDALHQKAVRQSHEQRLLLVDRALRTLSAGNRTLVRCTEEAQLLAQMCRVIVEIGGYRVAWVGYAQHDTNRSIFPMAQAGVVEGSIERMNFTWADTPAGQTPPGMAIRNGKPYVRLDIATDPMLAPFREKSLEMGFAAVSAFPLIVDDEVIGNLDIVARERDAFGDQELAVLTELAEDLSFGISSLRVRARHRNAEKMLERMAFVDQLTGLPNRIRLRERLERAIEHARREHRPLALLTLNVDRFRDINEVLGYRSGDRLLAQLAGRLTGLPVAPALIARIGVDVFAVLLPGADAEQAEVTARAFARALDDPFEVEGARVEVQASIGIALFPGHGVDADALIMRSDAAAFQAKRDHLGIAIFRLDSERENRERLTLMADLRRGIAENQLRLYCQPKANMMSGRVCGVEALVRWAHPTHGLILPDRFIPFAERTGLINALTHWVINASLAQCYSWRERGIDMPLAVNLSARNLLEPHLVERLAGLLDTWGATPSWLQFELTESALMEDPAGALDVLRRMQQMGFRLYVDDFGTGYSSLSYLQKLPIDAVKIDKSFVLGMQADPDAWTIVKSTIDMVHNIGLEVVAEGTETQLIWDSLATLHTDVAQGSYVADPMPADEFAEWNAQRHGSALGLH